MAPKPVDFPKPIDATMLKDRSVLITGGASGIGAGLAEAFAKAGAYVTIADIQDDAGNSLANQLQASGYHAQYQHADTTSWASQTAAFKSAISFSNNKTLDLVIPAAGLLNSKTVLDTAFATSSNSSTDPPEPTTAILKVNVVGVYYSTLLALHYFKATPNHSTTSSLGFKKHIIFVGSLASYVNQPLATDYMASKFGVRGIFKSLRYHEADIGFPFRANMIAPAFIRTPMIEDVVGMVQSIGVKVGTVEDVVKGVLRLACDEGIEGRSVCIAPEGKSFDMEDDPVGADGGKRFWEETGKGEAFGEGAKGFVQFDTWFPPA